MGDSRETNLGPDALWLPRVLEWRQQTWSAPACFPVQSLQPGTEESRLEDRKNGVTPRGCNIQINFKSNLFLRLEGGRGKEKAVGGRLTVLPPTAKQKCQKR